MQTEPFSVEVACKSCSSSYEVIGANKPTVELKATGPNQVIATSLEPIGTVSDNGKTKTDYKVSSHCPGCGMLNITEVAY